MSRIEVPMPQMGESIAEGTVSRWLKQPGDAIERDEPILEISTDKVDAEIPAPSAGVLSQVLVAEGETVEVGTVVAFIDAGAGASANSDGAAATATEQQPEAQQEEASAQSAPAAQPQPQSPAQPPAPEAQPADPAAQPPQSDAEDGEPICTATSEERLRTRSTPVVRRIASEAGVDLERVPGTGHLGRVTKQDILAFIDESGDAPAPAAAASPSAAAAPSAPAGPPTVPATPPSAAAAPSAPAAPPTAPAVSLPAPAAPPAAPAAPAPAPSPASGDAHDLWDRFHGQVVHPVFPVRDGDHVEAMSKVRRLTAEHMVLAKRIAPHVHSVVEIDFAAVDRLRRENKAKWAEQGARVSYTAFVAWACSRLLREFPTINGTVSGNNIVHRGNVSVGLAVDLNPGLIVPVVHDTDHLSLVGIARKIADLAGRARSRQLAPAEIQGATFTITNPGVLGTVVGMPVIPKGTSAILGTGSIDKRVAVLTDPDTGEDRFAVRKRSYFSLGYDHRLVDGADSARFLSRLKALLEDFPEDA